MLMEHTKNYESPSSFWKWSALTSISAALRDSVYISDGDSKLYPNIYVLFLAGSGARKNRPVGTSESLVASLNTTKVISGRASIQGILDELAHTETNKSTGKMMKGGSAIFYAPELSAGIVGDDAAISILTDIYDGKTNFKSVLRHSPSFKVAQIVFTAFMASNEVMIKQFFGNRATEGGLLARTILVVPDEFRPANSLWTTEEEDIANKASYQKLEEKLKEITLLAGRMPFSDHAKRAYDHWYIPFRRKYLKEGDKAGVAGRLHTTIKKISMILAANDLSMEVKKQHVEEAIDTCIALMPNYNIFIMASGKSNIANAGALIVTELMDAPNHTASRKDIMRIHWQDIGTAEEVDKILATLEAGGIIHPEGVAGGGLAYRLSKSVISKMKGEKS
jgi:hypothetical protein